MAAKTGRYTTGRAMADVRHAIIRKGNRARKARNMNQGVEEVFVLWNGPGGLREFIKSMDERAKKRKGGVVSPRRPLRRISK